VWPRFIQGFGQGFIFVPLSTLALATIRKDRLGNATAAFNVIRNVGGSCGVALAATLLSRRSQYHQTTLVGHVNIWSVDTAARLKEWSDHFVKEGGDSFTAQSRALAMIYRDTVGQAEVLAYADEFWLLSIMFFAITLLVPLMRRIRTEPLVAEARRPDRSSSRQEILHDDRIHPLAVELALLEVDPDRAVAGPGVEGHASGVGRER